MGEMAFPRRPVVEQGNRSRLFMSWVWRSDGRNTANNAIPLVIFFAGVPNTGGKVTPL